MDDVVDFEAVKSSLEEVSEEIFKSLSRDQKLLYQYIIAIREAQVPQTLAAQKAGPIYHSVKKHQ